MTKRESSPRRKREESSEREQLPLFKSRRQAARRRPQAHRQASGLAAPGEA